MNKQLFIISNESIFYKNNEFFCDNLDMKSIPEGLNDNFEINLIARKSKKDRTHKININNIKLFKNLLTFLLGIIKTFKNKNTKYFIISISPYTFFACLLIFFLKKKPTVYLRSNGYEEYKYIAGYTGVFIYHIMFSIISSISHLVSCRENILKGKKGKIVSPSRLNEKWFSNHKEVKLDSVKLLYVGRIRKEKGIFSLLNILKQNQNSIKLSIITSEKKENFKVLQNNIFVTKIENKNDDIIQCYDDHNIFILPSFTEGHPQVLDEALARMRPVIIFKEISHVIRDRNGIFVSERNIASLQQNINYIIENYQTIQNKLKNNTLPIKNDFLTQIKDIIEQF